MELLASIILAATFLLFYGLGSVLLSYERNG